MLASGLLIELRNKCPSTQLDLHFSLPKYFQNTNTSDWNPSEEMRECVQSIAGTLVNGEH